MLTKEMDTIKQFIQDITKSANPLSKLINNMQENIDQMNRELNYWKNFIEKTNEKLNFQQRLVIADYISYILDYKLNIIFNIFIIELLKNKLSQ